MSVEADKRDIAGSRAPLEVVKVRGVTKYFESGKGKTKLIHALGPLDLTIARGEFFSVVGPSGCGKSTLLELIAGLNVATEGEVFVNGALVRGSVAEGVGVVFQEDACFPWLSVRDNIFFGLRRGGIEAKEAASRVERALSLVGLQEFENAFPAQLSGGMKQRVCIARTLVLQPSLIILDEPFGALDQQTRLLMGDEVLNLWRATSATVLLITHSLDEAVLLSDRVGVMSARPGRFLEIITTGWPRERDSTLTANPEFGRLSAHLWSLLREQSKQMMGERAAG